MIMATPLSSSQGEKTEARGGTGFFPSRYGLRYLDKGL